MKATHVLEKQEHPDEVAGEASPLLPLLLGSRSSTTASAERPSVVVGELVAMEDQGRTPLVLYPGQPGQAAVPARSIVDLHGDHIGRRVLLMFESSGDGGPIIAGVLRDEPRWKHPDAPEHYEVQSDGERLIVTAKEQLVLRCGLASITLTKEGKVLIQGTYLSSRSSGVHRIKGGSVQVN
jgi:hypothetical protein